MYRDDGGIFFFGTLALLSIALTVGSVFRGAFVDESVAVSALETQGYSDIRIMERHWFLVGLRGCDGDDAAQFATEATNPAGKRVQLYVCAGWPFKGATIRTK